MSIKGLANKAKRLQAEQLGGDLPQLIVMQDIDNPDLFRGDGKQFTAAELEKMDATHQIIRIVWVDGNEWRDG